MVNRIKDGVMSRRKRFPSAEFSETVPVIGTSDLDEGRSRGRGRSKKPDGTVKPCAVAAALPEEAAPATPSRRVEGGVFHDCTVELDGREFIDCAFVRTVVRYRGEALPRIERCSFIASTFTFDGAAGRTVKLLRALGADKSGLQTVVRQMFVGII